MKRRNRKTQTHRLARKGATGAFRLWSGLIGLGVVFTVLAAGYLAQVSAVAAKGYVIRSLQSEVDDLKQESDRLEFEVAKGRSIVEVEGKIAELGMVPADRVEYMTISEPVVAKR